MFFFCQRWQKKSMSKKERQHESAALSVEQVAALLGIGRTLAYNSVKRGEIPRVRVGGRWLIPRAALQAWLNGTQRQPEARDAERG